MGNARIEKVFRRNVNGAFCSRSSKGFPSKSCQGFGVMDPLLDECGMVFNHQSGEVTETRVFAATDIRDRPLDKFNLRVAGLREALDFLERGSFTQVNADDQKRLAASGWQVWMLVFEFNKKLVWWPLVKKAQLSSKNKLRDGENMDLPCLSGKMRTSIVFPSPKDHLTKHPLRKGVRERQRVRRACRDPQVYIRTSLYKKKGTVEFAHPVSGATKVCSSEGDREENSEEKSEEKKEDYSEGEREENREVLEHAGYWREEARG